MIFVELDKEWFHKEFEKDPMEHEYEDEPYLQFVDTLFNELQTSERGFEYRKVKIQYPDGSQSLIAEESTKYADKDIVIYDFELNIWKHRFVIGIHHKTADGLQLLDSLLTTMRQHPSFMEINQDLVLVGEVNDVPHCLTCG